MSEAVTNTIKEHFAKYPVRSYPKGQILIHANEDPQYIFYLLEGQVRQYDISYRGDEIVVNIFKTGAFFPMLWALTKIANRYFFSTETDCKVHVAPFDETVEFLKSNPDVTLDLLTRLYIGVDGLLGRMAHLMAGSARSRLLYELLIECRRFGTKMPDDSYTIDVNESGLAARTGLSRETVSREIHKLRDDKMIEVNRKGIVIKNKVALEKKLGTEL